MVQEEVEKKAGARLLSIVWISFKVQGEAIRGFKQENEHGLVCDFKRSPAWIKDNEDSNQETSWRAAAVDQWLLLGW